GGCRASAGVPGMRRHLRTAGDEAGAGTDPRGRWAAACRNSEGRRGGGCLLPPVPAKAIRVTGKDRGPAAVSALLVVVLDPPAMTAEAPDFLPRLLGATHHPWGVLACGENDSSLPGHPAALTRSAFKSFLARGGLHAP